MSSTKSFVTIAWELYDYFAFSETFVEANIIENGWYDLIKVDRPDGFHWNELSVALEVFSYLMVDSEGSWRNLIYVLFGTSAFLKGALNIQPSQAQWEKLKEVSGQETISRESLQGWFTAVYGQIV